MQQTIEIPTDKGPVELTINGSFDRVVLVVHGLGGHVGEWLHQTAARLMPRHGLATARISLYNEGGRRLGRVSLQRHVEDVNSAIEWLMDRYGELYIAGHSLGGVVSILSEHEKAVKMALWDLPRSFRMKSSLTKGSGSMSHHGQFLWLFRRGLLMNGSNGMLKAC